VAIVDDEPIARRRIRRLLRERADVEILCEAADGLTAIERIADAAPDVVLLDVQMPECDGLEVARRLPAPRPLIVFLTAFDRYAVQAFEIHAVDYLLKPVSRDRLAEALGRAAERLASRTARSPLAVEQIIDAVRGRRSWIERLPVRTQGRVQLIDVATIDWISAADNYVTLHCASRAHLLRETLARLAADLDPARFVRVHRSTLVRLDAVVRLESAMRGDYDVVLKDGARVTLSRTYRTRFEAVLGRRIS
jgi:two-component system LytT family response regulator